MATSVIDRTKVEKAMLETNSATKILIGVLSVLFGVGIYFYITQLKNGLIVTGLSYKIFWGMYITNFVFFIGVSHAGTLISAILRVTGAKWRTPITRLAEEITVLALIFGASSVLIDMGRVDRVFNMIFSGNINSPLIWDFISISFYLVGSIIFLYLPLIPDFAYYRDNLPDKHKIRKRFYKIFAVGYKGTEKQKKILEKNMHKMSFVIIPVAVSVHTVVSWIMSMTWRTGWDSTIFGPYFVVGAIFSGLASLLMAMVLFTIFYNLQEFLTKKHFVSLAKLFLVFAITYFYFTLSEYLTGGFKSNEAETDLLQNLFYGQFAPMFWTFAIGGLVIPMIILWVVINKNESLSEKAVLWLVFAAATLVNIGMWIKRYIITVPALARETVDEGWHVYIPSLAEIGIFVGQISGFVLLYIIMSKLVPIVSLWEVEHEALQEAHDKQ